MWHSISYIVRAIVYFKSCTTAIIYFTAVKVFNLFTQKDCILQIFPASFRFREESCNHQQWRRMHMLLAILTINCLSFPSSTLSRHVRKLKNWLLASPSLSVCPHGATRLPLDGFSLNLIFEYFSKICWENWCFINIRQ